MAEIEQKELVRLDSIKNARNIAAVGPMVMGAVHVADQPLLLAGVDFEATPILKPWWRINGQIPDHGSVMAGSRAAKVLGLQTGDTLDIKGASLRISGVLKETGSQDDHLLFSRLGTAQTLLNKPEKLSMVEVAALCEACPIEDMVHQISGALPGARVMAIQQVVKGRMETLAHFKKFSYGISAVVILIGSLVVLVTLMGSVRERTQEIGIFRAVGFRRRHVMRIIFIEAAMVALLAGILGYALGTLTVKLGMTVIKGSIVIPFNPTLALMAVGLALSVGLISSAYPAWMAARLDPSRALRSL
jgi:putative ABC transport system permease protein